MAQYTAIFTKPYEDGYENLPSQNTPITAQTLNDKDDAIVNIETYLSTNDIPSDAEGLSYDNTDSGLTADDVQSAIDEIVDVQSTFADKAYNADYLKSRNLCNNSTNIVGYYDGYGSHVPSGDHRTSALIEVEPNTTYIGSLFDTSNNSRVGNLVYAEWDENQNFIRQITDETVTTGNTTKYLRVRNYNSQSELVKTDHYAYQLEIGNEATAYTPYVPSNVELDLQKADISAIGTDESGRTTASKAYAQGDIFYKDGFIGEALTAVASGATWTLNTNYKQTTLAEIVAALRA